MKKQFSNINQKDPVSRILGFCLASSLSFVLFSAVVLASLRTSATTSHEDQVSITVPTSCTMGGNIASGEEHTATLTPGTYSGNEGIGKTTLTTFCNDYNGFSIYAIGYTGNSYGNNTLLGANTDITIPTGIYTEGDTTSKWSMRVDKVTDSSQTYNPANMTITNSFDSWHNVPTTYTKVAQYKATTGSSITDNDKGAKVTTTYSAYVASNQAADTYEGQVKYTMVHPYNANTPFGNCLDSATCMQTVTSSDLAILLPNIGSTTTLYDSRDGQAYTVAKLADNKYWMTENLNIAGGTAISATDTDITSNYINSFTTSNNLTKTGNTIILPASSTTGFNQNNYSFVYNSGNKVNCGTYAQNTPCYSYYSWDAATLGSGRSLSTDNNDAPHSICPKGWKLPTSRTTSATDWQTASNFYVMAHQYGLDSTTSTSENDDDFYGQAGPNTNLGFLLAGYYASSTFINGGDAGHYWSSTSTSSGWEAFALVFSKGYVRSANGNYRYYGLSARCLFSGQ